MKEHLFTGSCRGCGKKFESLYERQLRQNLAVHERFCAKVQAMKGKA